MSESKITAPTTTSSSDVEPHLTYLKLAFMVQHYAELATQAAHKMWPHVEYLARLVEGEAHLRRDRATQSRIRLARFPVIKTLEQFESMEKLGIMPRQAVPQLPCRGTSA